jgi:two-component system NarL family sensor kinase
MMADVLETRNPQDRQIAELRAILGEALSDTRTISHLFHPPFLDEIGFASAARWLIEGYEERTGVSVSVVLPSPEQRLPRTLELTLYRILQEALNNIHRHARSARAEVIVQTDPEWITLRVRDHGLGIPGQTFDGSRTNGKQPGVGLTGMKERVKEQGDSLEVRSSGTGTEIIVRIPVTSHVSASLGA